MESTGSRRCCSKPGRAPELQLVGALLNKVPTQAREGRLLQTDVVPCGPAAAGTTPAAACGISPGRQALRQQLEALISSAPRTSPAEIEPPAHRSKDVLLRLPCLVMRRWISAGSRL
jgi:hypothetical protein